MFYVVVGELESDLDRIHATKYGSSARGEELVSLVSLLTFMFFLDWRKLPGRTLKLQRYPSDHDNYFSQPLNFAGKIKQHCANT